VIRILVVDDEEIARLRLRQLLRAIPDAEIAGEAADGEEAMRQAAALRPDVLLLDIQMPGATGLDVAACLPAPRPAIVFCTAFDQHAIEAFELEALDYLLKPVTRARLARALDRVRRASAVEADGRLDRMLQAARAGTGRLLARAANQYCVVPLASTVCFTSELGLTRVHARSAAYTLDLTLNELERRLDPALFFRVSRGAIVNLDCIAGLSPIAAGLGDVALTNGMRLEVSRRRMAALLEKLRA
jgi:two-component system, LytTR family, response regulator